MATPIGARAPKIWRASALRMHTTKIVLIDDHEILRAGLRDFLATLPAYEVVGEAGTAF